MLASMALLTGATTAHAALRGDTLVLTNGDRITGEITRLEYGKLQFKTDYMGKLSIEWSGVAQLMSRQTFDVESIHGQHHFGEITTSAEGQWLVVRQPGSNAEVALADVARIAPVERKLWERVNGAFSAGYDFASSSDVEVWSAHFDVTYRAALYTMSLRVDSDSTSSPEEGTDDRQRIAFSYQRIQPDARFWAGVASFDRNQELGVDGRLQAGGGIGRYLFQSATAEVSGFAGVVANQEWVTGGNADQQNLEGLLVGTWRIFQFTAPETSLAFSAGLLPSLTQSPRYRAGLDASLRREMIDDFFIDLSIWYDYDSVPPGDVEVKDDFGVTTSLGYSF